MTSAKGGIWFPCNFSSWFTTWKVPEGCTLPSGKHRCPSLLYESLQIFEHAHFAFNLPQAGKAVRIPKPRVFV